MQIGTDQLWVVVYRSQDAYSIDTSMPEEVFTTQVSADAFCAELNSVPPRCSWEKPCPWYVTTLSERLDDLRDNLRESGARDERDNSGLY